MRIVFDNISRHDKDSRICALGILAKRRQEEEEESNQRAIKHRRGCSFCFGAAPVEYHYDTIEQINLSSTAPLFLSPILVALFWASKIGRMPTWVFLPPANWRCSRGPEAFLNGQFCFSRPLESIMWLLLQRRRRLLHRKRFALISLG